MYIDKTSPKINRASKEHCNRLIDKIKSKRYEHGSPEIICFLTENRIEQILLGNPRKLYQLQMLFFRKILDKFTLQKWENYIRIEKKRKPTDSEISLIQKYSEIKNILSKIFDYKDFISINSENKYKAYNLAENLDIPTCVYCNRMYTKTVIDNKGLIRPTFDHYFSKEKHPLLALSFYNLIPCCTICNSSIKGTKELFLDKHFHPYVSDRKDINKQIKFSYYNRSLDSYGFTIKSPKNSKGEKTVEFFKLKEIYEAHKDEISDLARLRYAYSETYLKDLRENIMKRTISEKEVYRLAFGTYIEESEFHKRPLSKMKRDILSELGILKHFKK